MSKNRSACGTVSAGRIGANLASAAMCGSLALVSAVRTDAGQAAEAAKPFLTFYSAGADAYLRSPKDKWLLDAVHHLEANGIQFPPEIQRDLDRNDEGRLLLGLVREVLTTRIAGTMALVEADGGGPPMPDGQLTFLGNARRPGTALEQTLVDAMRTSGIWSEFTPDPADPALRTMQPPDGPKIWFGTIKQGGAGATVASVGRAPTTEPMSFERFGISKGVEPQFAFELDLAPLQPYLGMASTMLPQGPDGRGALEQLGIVSKTPMIFRASSVSDGVDSRLDIRLVNAVKALGVTDAQKALVLEPGDMQWIPLDASHAWVGKMDLRGTITMIVDQYNAQAEAFGLEDEGDFEGGDDGMGGGERKPGAGADSNAAGAGGSDGMVDRWVSRHLGLDLRRDLIAPLGTMVATHSSESLGSGIFGTVLVVSLSDPATMQKSLAHLAAKLAEQPEPRNAGFGMRARSQKGLDALYSLSFAGLPIPVQLSIAVANGALIVGMSPQSVIAAAVQAKAKTSIVDEPGFKAMDGAAGMKGAASFGWYDTPAIVAGGYGALLAVANAADGLMLPQSGGATPFTVAVPTAGELAKGAKPSVWFGRLDGDDMAWSCRSDGSFSVQLATMSSYLSGGSMATSALLAGALLPALTKARDAAREAQMEARMHAEHAEQARHDEDAGAAAARPAAGGGNEMQTARKLREIGIGCVTYSAEKDDRLPTGFVPLVEAGILPEIPANPRTAPGLTGRFVLQTSSTPLSQIRNPSATAIAWEEFDRWPQGGVWVLFADGHVAKVDDEDELGNMSIR